MFNEVPHALLLDDYGGEDEGAWVLLEAVPEEGDSGGGGSGAVSGACLYE